MRPLLFLAADYANITREGKLNVMGIFNDIYAQTFPARHSSMQIVIKLGAELGEYGQTRNFTLKLLDGSGNQIFDLSGQFQVPPGGHGRKPEVNLILELKDIVFPKEDIYQFVLLVDKDHKGELTLYVNKVEAPKPAAE
ncbi:MAG TPA: hypothetical protein PKC99_17335 [Anaerolineales bacterium]|jgi:hypothetical protein|nr:hypothetical protein [Anaerolineales bacterium]